MKRILALLVAASVCGCSAGLTQTGSVWTGSRIPAGADDFGFAEEEEAGLAGRFIARLGMSLYPGTKDNPVTLGDEQIDPRITLGVGYTMTLDMGDVEVGLDFVPDAKDGFNNVYFNLRGDYIYWLGESGFAATGGLGLFFERNVKFEEIDGGDLYGSVYFHIDIGAMYLIPDQAFDLRMALQIPVAKPSEMSVSGIILMSVNYAF